jgi:hypothetical protein
LNEKGNACLIERTKSATGTAISEICLADLNGTVQKSYDTTSITPQGWSSDKMHLVGRRIIAGQGIFSNEALLIDRDLNIITSYNVPREYGELKEFCWDESSGYICFSTSKNELYLVNVNGAESPKLIDRGKIESPKFTAFTQEVSQNKSAYELNERDRKDIAGIIKTWLSPHLEAAKGNHGDFDIRQLWDLLSSDSPIRKKGYSNFSVYVAEGISPLTSFTVDSIDYEGDKVVAKCTCNWAADYYYLEYYPPSTNFTRFIFVREKESWKIYDVEYQQID